MTSQSRWLRRPRTFCFLSVFSWLSISSIDTLSTLPCEQKTFYPYGFDPYTVSFLIESPSGDIYFQEISVKDYISLIYMDDSNGQMAYQYESTCVLFYNNTFNLPESKKIQFLYIPLGDLASSDSLPPTNFTLPFVTNEFDVDSAYKTTVFDKSIYVFCISLVQDPSFLPDEKSPSLKDKYIQILSSDGDRYISYRVPTDYCIVHSNSDTLTVIIEDNKYILKPFKVFNPQNSELSSYGHESGLYLPRHSLTLVNKSKDDQLNYRQYLSFLTQSNVPYEAIHLSSLTSMDSLKTTVSINSEHHISSQSNNLIQDCIISGKLLVVVLEKDYMKSESAVSALYMILLQALMEYQTYCDANNNLIMRGCKNNINAIFFSESLGDDPFFSLCYEYGLINDYFDHNTNNYNKDIYKGLNFYTLQNDEWKACPVEDFAIQNMQNDIKSFKRILVPGSSMFIDQYKLEPLLDYCKKRNLFCSLCVKEDHMHPALQVMKHYQDDTPKPTHEKTNCIEEVTPENEEELSEKLNRILKIDKDGKGEAFIEEFISGIGDSWNEKNILKWRCNALYTPLYSIFVVYRDIDKKTNSRFYQEVRNNKILDFYIRWKKLHSPNIKLTPATNPPVVKELMRPDKMYWHGRYKQFFLLDKGNTEPLYYLCYLCNNKYFTEELCFYYFLPYNMANSYSNLLTEIITDLFHYKLDFDSSENIFCLLDQIIRILFNNVMRYTSANELTDQERMNIENYSKIYRNLGNQITFKRLKYYLEFASFLSGKYQTINSKNDPNEKLFALFQLSTLCEFDSNIQLKDHSTLINKCGLDPGVPIDEFKKNLKAKIEDLITSDKNRRITNNCFNYSLPIHYDLNQHQSPCRSFRIPNPFLKNTLEFTGKQEYNIEKDEIIKVVSLYPTDLSIKKNSGKYTFDNNIMSLSYNQVQGSFFYLLYIELLIKSKFEPLKKYQSDLKVKQLYPKYRTFFDEYYLRLVLYYVNHYSNENFPGIEIIGRQMDANQDSERLYNYKTFYIQNDIKSESHPECHVNQNVLIIDKTEKDIQSTIDIYGMLNMNAEEPFFAYYLPNVTNIPDLKDTSIFFIPIINLNNVDYRIEEVCDGNNQRRCLFIDRTLYGCKVQLFPGFAESWMQEANPSIKFRISFGTNYFEGIPSENNISFDLIVYFKDSKDNNVGESKYLSYIIL